MKKIFLCIIIPVVFSGCKPEEIVLPEAPGNLTTPSYNHVKISTDKAAYNPGDKVNFEIDNTNLPASTTVRYRYLGELIAEEILQGNTWTWKTPMEDFRGYMVEVYDGIEGAETIYTSIAVDVSSDWTRFPRYGFLSDYSQLSSGEIDAVLDNLCRHHINGLQFYDWHNKHHKPLPMNGSIPADSWKDIINKDVYFSTVKNYIDAAHSRNMRSMFYNLIYGAWSGADSDGVSEEWYVYTDKTHTNRDFHPLSSPFLSNIYMLDPANTNWQEYILRENQVVYDHLDFDGFHMDQLGDRGTRFKYNGTSLNLAQTYEPFIEAAKADAPEKKNVMNAVNQYGQQGISAAPTDFLYTEVWSPNDTYKDLSNIIRINENYGAGAKNTVLAAYVNYDLANNKGYFNTASVLMTDAVIFAFGGSHLELGEHMLGKEYFPNDNLDMKADLIQALVRYYDFMTAYQNLLRDGGSFNQVSVSSLDGKITPGKWPVSAGSVAVIAKKKEKLQILHLVNFKDSQTDEWRDNSGIQAAPGLIRNAKIMFTSEGVVKKIWTASPDIIGGVSRRLNFEQLKDKVAFTLPELKYWSMVVIEYE
ncbi:MAG: glycoside hydrolase family 66 protein [Bacteroidales bacterium]|nr:glycoside hydrolase family 66 protein [Bacteroidales bacterium]